MTFWHWLWMLNQHRAGCSSIDDGSNPTTAASLYNGFGCGSIGC